jgi:hypothetical protein
MSLLTNHKCSNVYYDQVFFTLVTMNILTKHMDCLEHTCIHITNGVIEISHMMPHDCISSNLTKLNHYDYMYRHTLLL